MKITPAAASAMATPSRRQAIPLPDATSPGLKRPILSAIASSPTPVAPRFWGKVKRGEPDVCWPFQGCTSSWGYGIIQISGKGYIASRVAYALATEEEPGKFHVCHTCDNPICCNPAHLWLGTDADNVADMFAKGREKKNTITRCAHGHEFIPGSSWIIKHPRGNYRRCKKCFNVRRQAYRAANKAKGLPRDSRVGVANAAPHAPPPVRVFISHGRN